MDANVQKALTDKLYDKRKAGAFELENVIRECLATNDHERVAKVVSQLCHEFAYAVHQPHARNGGLIGLAAAAIALGPEVARYLEEIVPPVLACFTDQDARVRYYACESMYNIAKVAKGETLLYFNQIFDALCKLTADSELSVKNGAELLDRLVKDIVSESAATYISVLKPYGNEQDKEDKGDDAPQEEQQPAFSLSRFVPLLQERITVLNPYTRMFLVSWITLLDSIPDLELVTHLPSFLAGLFKFLSDNNQDVHTATQVVLDRLLSEIKKIARLKRGIAESKRSQDGARRKRRSSDSSAAHSFASSPAAGNEGETDAEASEHDDAVSDSDLEGSGYAEEDWVPGQDVQVDHAQILDIMVTFLGGSSEQDIQLTALRWIDSFFDICPEDILTFVPRLLSQVLPAMSNEGDSVRQAAARVNDSLMNYILSLPDESSIVEHPSAAASAPVVQSSLLSPEKREATQSTSRIPRQPGGESLAISPPDEHHNVDGKDFAIPRPTANLDWEATVNALTLQFLNDHEATRVAALNWLIMLHRKAPAGRKLEINDGTFPALLKTLSDASEQVVTRDLVLLSQMSKNTDDSKFSTFMVNLLNLFATDRKLLETRGNLIIRQLCISLNPERIFRTLADCLEKEEDVEFASIMVQNLNNNLITAPELADLRKRLRNLDSRDGQTFFAALFRSWCHNAVATFSLCLLAQAYEQAYLLLQIFAELEMTVNMLIQIDKLVQLLESPVFTYLRLQLLEPERYPHLYKCLYGLLMFLPQSAAFAALKNRLNSVSAIGYLHIAPRGSGPSGAAGGPPAGSSFSDRPNRLKSRDDNAAIRWSDMLDKFKHTQERARRSSPRIAAYAGVGDLDRSAPYSHHAGASAHSRNQSSISHTGAPHGGPPVPDKDDARGRSGGGVERGGAGGAGSSSRPGSGLAGNIGRGGLQPGVGPGGAVGGSGKTDSRLRTGLGLGRFAGGGRKGKK